MNFIMTDSVLLKGSRLRFTSTVEYFPVKRQESKNMKSKDY